MAGHSDIMRATDTKVAPSYGDVGATRLWAPVGCSRRIIDGRDLERGGGIQSSIYTYIHNTYMYMNTYMTGNLCEHEIFLYLWLDS